MRRPSLEDQALVKRQQELFPTIRKLNKDVFGIEELRDWQADQNKPAASRRHFVVVVGRRRRRLLLVAGGDVTLKKDS